MTIDTCYQMAEFQNSFQNECSIKGSESSSRSVVSWVFATPWAVAHKAPLIHGILQARILEWVAMPFSRGSSQSRDWTQVSCIVAGFFTDWASREIHGRDTVHNYFYTHHMHMHPQLLPWKVSVRISGSHWRLYSPYRNIWHWFGFQMIGGCYIHADPTQ